MSPDGKSDAINTATPFDSVTGTSNWVNPLKKVTVPVGVGPEPAGATVAVNVTGLPKETGLADVIQAVVVDAFPLIVSVFAADVLVR